MIARAITACDKSESRFSGFLRLHGWLTNTALVRQANSMRTRLWLVLMSCLLLASAQPGYAAVGTTVPISASLATQIAKDFFPLTVTLTTGKLFLTNPTALLLENGRVGLQVRFQAYDHRPAQDIAISEMGQAAVSGILGYDPATQQILLADPRIDTLEFDHQSEVTQGFLGEIKNAWSAQVTNPLRADIPPHPYIVPFKNNIQDLSYDGKTIILSVSYQ